MTYEELKQKYPDKSFGEVNVEREYSSETGWRYVDEEVVDEGWRVFLNHSCDEWVIGSPKDAEIFSKNLSEAIEWIKTRDDAVSLLDKKK